MHGSEPLDRYFLEQLAVSALRHERMHLRYRWALVSACSDMTISVRTASGSPQRRKLLRFSVGRDAGRVAMARPPYDWAEQRAVEWFFSTFDSAAKLVPVGFRETGLLLFGQTYGILARRSHTIWLPPAELPHFMMGEGPVADLLDDLADRPAMSAQVRKENLPLRTQALSPHVELQPVPDPTNKRLPPPPTEGDLF